MKKQEKSKKLEAFTIKNSTFDLKTTTIEEVTKIKNPIIFDTNFLFTTFNFRIDVIAEIERLIGKNYKLYIYEGTIGELESIERKKEKNKKYLPLIVKMLHIYNFKIIKSNQTYIDDQILENLSKKILIATNDKKLRQEIQSQQNKVIYLRQKSYLEIS